MLTEKKFRNKYHGFLQIYKPAGMTSHDVVDKLRKILEQRKIGHTGTLDLLAEGLMVVCLGRATKAARFVSDLGKEYEAKICLGLTSKTFDREGVEKDAEPAKVNKLTEKKFTTAMKKFVGEIEQQVPMYSAVRVDGQRLYKLARKGIEVDPPKRKITVYNIELLSFDNPYATIKISCSSGTYIRTLADDIGKELGCGAYLEDLKRTQIGDMKIDDAFTFDEIAHLHNKNQLEMFVLTYHHVLNHASLSVSSGYRPLILNGKALYLDSILETNGEFESGDTITIKDNTGAILAMATAELSSQQIRNRENSRRLFRYIKVFHH